MDIRLFTEDVIKCYATRIAYMRLNQAKENAKQSALRWPKIMQRMNLGWFQETLETVRIKQQVKGRLIWINILY